jgi:tRNA dimethylallyltransferase
MTRDPRPKIQDSIFLAGPTAVGKSGVALLLAEQIGGEIISVDSMQVYRGLDIGTAKPTPAERARVPHHLIDVAELNEPFDAARFVALANEAVAETHLVRMQNCAPSWNPLSFRNCWRNLSSAIQ